MFTRLAPMKSEPRRRKATLAFAGLLAIFCHQAFPFSDHIPKESSGFRPSKKPSPGATVDVEWDSLGQLDYRTGKTTPVIDKYLATTVRIPGFVVPLEDSAGLVSEFLLVPYPQACIHVPAPPPNMVVYVKMDPGKKIKPQGWDPIVVTGFLEIKKTQSVYAETAYQMSGLSVEPFKDPDR